jgi:hypothetical protein
MAYEQTLAQINTNLGGMSRSNTPWGFPANTNFHTLLMSYWMCGPHAAPGYTGWPGVWPAFTSAEFFGFGPGINGSVAGNPFIFFTNQATWGAAPYTGFFSGNIPPPLPTSPAGCLLHFMMSVDTHAQVVQVYINDKPVTVTGTWTGAQPLDFNIANILNIWDWDVSGVISAAVHAALGDAWISNTPSFVDLSVVANRRKFISSQYTPVDLGNDGSAPFGYQPAMYMSVRPGGVATDILTNRGVGGGTWGYSQNPPTFQTDGVCLAIPLPPPLAMDDVNCTTIPALERNLVFLEWSDDRGHSYGNAVGQPMGEAGEYRTSLQWQRLGMSRDRVFRVFWSVPTNTVLQGCWLDAAPGQS